eukprot:GILI01003228.1.p1 GENE.GILI01003228.1~~GILI01003228.1.p1  ORF type:complete len:876 (-),score=300.10 GILI01003228.1:348-2975(-)
MTDLDKGKDDELGFESNAFEALQRDFHEVLQELVGDKSLERFRLEYEKLHRALIKSHESEKRLIKKCRELNADIVSNAAKVQTALKLSQEDQQTISTLKKEIDKAWKMVDAAHEKEQRAKETIQQLKSEISNLSRLVEQGAGLSLGQENTVNELLKVKEELTKERDMQNTTISNLHAENAQMFEKVQKLETEKLTLDNEIQGLKDMIAAKKAETEREQRRKERLEQELKALRGNMDSKHAEIKQKQALLQQGQEQIAKLEQQLKDSKAQMDKVMRDYEDLSRSSQKLSTDLDQQMQENARLIAENSAREMELRAKQEEINHVRQELLKMTKMRESVTKKVQSLEEEKRELEASRDMLKGDMIAVTREIESQKKQAEADRKQIEDLLRERDLLNKNVIKADERSKHQVDLVRIHENTKKNLENEITAYKSEAQKMRKLIYSLEKDREKYGIEASQANAKYYQALEELKLKDNGISELQKKIQESDAKLKQQQNLYEAVRSDRNLYSKHLIESQDEIAEMKRKFKIMNHQIDQLKEEISAKDAALIKEHLEHHKVVKDCESLRMEVTKLKKRIQSAKLVTQNQHNEIAKLKNIIQEAEEERQNQKKQYEQVINERDILGTQLIRRNDELALLYEKIKIQQSTLSKGEVQYAERLEDIKLLKLKIADMKRELAIAKQQVSNVGDLKKEVYHLQRDLLQERTKVKALSEELENPMNVHRWRKLEGSDPATYEMIQKIQTLQKRLIAKTEEVVEKDLLIQEKEKLYVELKNILARQPGPEVAEQLSIYQQNLKEKTRQMKAMASELNMYQAQVNEYKYEIERLARELQEVKRKYYEQKRREHMQREASKSMGMEGSGKIMPQVTGPGVPRFTGGGFNLSS